ncbi:MAG: glutamate racemase [Candidatus Peregrinibacteria bacterium]
MIGVFDSGFGGLSTVRELIKLFPQHDMLYLGDSARAPYGNRSKETVTKYTQEGVEFLFSQGAKIVLIACNTASTDALRFLQQKYGDEKKVLGALIPAVEEALEKTRYGNIGVVGTRGTILAGNFEKEIHNRAPLLYHPTEKKALPVPQVFSVACPLLVPLIEEGWIKKPETRMILKKYLLKLKSCHIDTLILGCTHYPLLEKEFVKKMGKNCVIVNSGRSQAQKFEEYLKNHSEISETLSQNGIRQFFTTDSPERFAELGSQFLGQKMGKVEKVEF